MTTTAGPQVIAGETPSPARRARRRALGKRVWAYSVPLLLFGLFLVEVGVPLVMAVLWSLVDPEHPWSYPDPFPRHLSWFQWQYVFEYTGVVQAIGTSLSLAVMSTVVAFVLALPTAYGIGRHSFRGKEIVRLLILLPIVLPGMIVALFLSRVFGYLGLSQTFFGLVLGHTLMGLPYMLRLLSTSFEAIPQEIADAAANLGASELVRFRKIYIPMILPGIFAGAIFTFITSMEEFSLTFVIGTPDYQTIPTILFSFLGYNFVRTHAAVVALLLMVPNITLLFLADRLLKVDFLSAAYGKR
jgi:putative spermidine/putrescine transport system permease protein